MKCPRCKHENDAASHLEDPAATPASGDVSVCFYCAYLGLFTGDGLEVREPTEEERAGLMAASEVRRLVEGVIAFQVSRADDRQRFPCGCRMATAFGVFYFQPCSATCDIYAYSIEASRKAQKPIEIIDVRS